MFPSKEKWDGALQKVLLNVPQLGFHLTGVAIKEPREKNEARH